MSAHVSTPELLVLHGLRLLGTADADQLAAHYGTDVAVLRDELEAARDAGLVEARHGRFPGFRLTDAGRSHAVELVADELQASGTRRAIEDSYAAFRQLNGRLLVICSRWQLKGEGAGAVPNRHDDDDYDAAVIADLVDLHGAAAPVVGQLGEILERLAGYGARLDAALAHVRAGEHQYLTKPMFPSYHSVWFELHEDYLATLGLERATDS